MLRTYVVVSLPIFHGPADVQRASFDRILVYTARTTLVLYCSRRTMPGSRTRRLLAVVTLGVLALAPISTLAGPDSTTSPPAAPTEVLILYDFPRMAPAIVAH